MEIIDCLVCRISSIVVGNNFVGALAYADDIVLVAPTASALRKLLSICGDNASEYCISFNVVKSKCLVILPRNRRVRCEYFEECSFSINKSSLLNHLNISVT